MPKFTSKNKETKNENAFYPQVGTAFCDRSGTPRILITESQENLAAVNDPEDGWVAVHSLEDGYDDFPNWLSSVKSGLVEVVWCPVMKRVTTNDDYLKHWGVK